MKIEHFWFKLITGIIVGLIFYFWLVRPKEQTIARLETERDSLILVKTDWSIFPDEPTVKKGDVLFRLFLVKRKEGFARVLGKQEWPSDTLRPYLNCKDSLVGR